jgi:hypothetical protein
MSTPLKNYKVYCYDSAHNVLTADMIEASSDEGAIAKATAAGFGSKCEIWLGRRLVAQLDAQRRQA